MKQATVKLPSGEHCFLSVPVWAKDIKAYYKPLIKHTYVDWLDEDETYVYPVDIFGNWQLLGADPTALTEEEAGEIVNWLEIAGLRGWQNYLVKNDYVFPFNTATASIDSLAESLGISKPYVILKNIEI